MLSEVQTHPNAALKASVRAAAAPHGENVHSLLKPSVSSSNRLSLTLGKRPRENKEPKAERVARPDQQRPTVKRVRISDVTSVRTINSSPESPRKSLSPSRQLVPLSLPAPVLAERPVHLPSAATPMTATPRSPSPWTDEDEEEELGPPNWGLMPVALVVQPHSALQTPSSQGLALELHSLAHEPIAFPTRKPEPAGDSSACKLPNSPYPGIPTPHHVVWRSSAVFAPAFSEPCATSLRPAQWSSGSAPSASADNTKDIA